MARGYNLSKRANKKLFRRNATRTHVKNMPGHSLMRGGDRIIK